MGELLIVPEKNHFDQQAKLHQQIQERLQEVVSTFDLHHETILSQLDPAQPNQIEQYRQWWQSFRASLLQHASLHEQFAQHLQTAQQNYQTTEQGIANSLQTDATPS